jgi:nucleoid DNA-binding protein
MVDPNDMQALEIRTIVLDDMQEIKKQRREHSLESRELMKKMFDRVRVQLDPDQQVKLDKGIKKMMRKRRKERKSRNKRARKE